MAIATPQMAFMALARHLPTKASRAPRSVLLNSPAKAQTSANHRLKQGRSATHTSNARAGGVTRGNAHRFPFAMLSVNETHGDNEKDIFQESTHTARRTGVNA